MADLAAFCSGNYTFSKISGLPIYAFLGISQTARNSINCTNDLNIIPPFPDPATPTALGLGLCKGNDGHGISNDWTYSILSLVRIRQLPPFLKEERPDGSGRRGLSLLTPRGVLSAILAIVAQTMGSISGSSNILPSLVAAKRSRLEKRNQSFETTLMLRLLVAMLHDRSSLSAYEEFCLGRLLSCRSAVINIIALRAPDSVCFVSSDFQHLSSNFRNVYGTGNNAWNA